MDQIKLPLLSQSICKRFQSKQRSHYSQLHTNSYSEQISYVLPNHQPSNYIEQIRKAKVQVYRKKSPVQVRQVASLQDIVSQNKSFQTKLKLFVFKSRNNQLIELFSQKKKHKIPQFCTRNQSVSQQKLAINKLKKQIQPKWKLYTKKRKMKSFYEIDSFINFKSQRSTNKEANYQN